MVKNEIEIQKMYRFIQGLVGNIDFYPQGNGKLLELIICLTYVNTKITLSAE